MTRVEPVLGPTVHASQPGAVRITPVFTVEEQRTSVWCWAAVTAGMLAPRWFLPLDQCSVVETVLHEGPPPVDGHIPYRFLTTKRLGVALDALGAQWTVGSITGFALWNAGHFGSWHTARRDLVRRRPPGLQVRLGLTGAAHAVLVAGIALHPTRGPVVVIGDPAELWGRSDVFLDDAPAYRGGTHWTHMFRTI